MSVPDWTYDGQLCRLTLDLAATLNRIAEERDQYQPSYANAFYSVTGGTLRSVDLPEANGGSNQSGPQTQSLSEDIVGLADIDIFGTGNLFEVNDWFNQPGPQTQSFSEDFATFLDNDSFGPGSSSEVGEASSQPEPQTQDLSEDIVALVEYSEPVNPVEDDRPSQDFKCGKPCRGKFNGSHKCVRQGRTLTVSCLWGDNCSSVFKTRNEFNRHFKTHLKARPGAIAVVLLDCPVPFCTRVGERGFIRNDNLVQHRRRVHREYIPVQKYRFGPGTDDSEVQRTGPRDVRQE